MNNPIALLAVFTAVFLAFPTDANAYLDPGTGSYLFQILIASLIGAAFAIKIFWKRIAEWVKGLFSGRKGA